MTEPDTLLKLKEVVRALEIRFPDHNGPFEYGTRLAEEAGELIEAIDEVKDGNIDEIDKNHLVKEMQDVLRVVYGIAKLYSLEKDLPDVLDDFDDQQNPNDPIKYITQIGIRAGELASAINHAEGMGVKKEKHGDRSIDRVFEKAYSFAQVVVWVMRFFKCQAMLLDQLADSYDDYKTRGFISIR